MPITHQIGLAKNTVKVPVTAILKKLECHSRTQAAVLVKALEREDEALSPQGVRLRRPSGFQQTHAWSSWGPFDLRWKSQIKMDDQPFGC
ncbi:hypothetical protein J2W68_000534 [Luteimonas terrae]|uniref:HTH luxR-type domain-containing protein n=1 Tax=Luteimonas terrae TaxID=1530191 RepID=A0ABU1XUL4_9GAMM|nr:hypothetical protein [Luteimonas terrae]